MMMSFHHFQPISFWQRAAQQYNNNDGVLPRYLSQQASWLDLFTLAYLFLYGHVYHAWVRAHFLALPPPPISLSECDSHHHQHQQEQNKKRAPESKPREFVLHIQDSNKVENDQVTLQSASVQVPCETPPPLVPCLDEHHSDDEDQQGQDDENQVATESAKYTEIQVDNMWQTSETDVFDWMDIYLEQKQKVMYADALDATEVVSIILLCMTTLALFLDELSGYEMARRGTLVVLHMCRYLHACFHPVRHIPLLQ